MSTSEAIVTPHVTEEKAPSLSSSNDIEPIDNEAVDIGAVDIEAVNTEAVNAEAVDNEIVDNEAVIIVMGSVDLLSEIVTFVLSTKDVQSQYMLSLMTVSKNFKDVLGSNKVWKSLCHERWSSKFGFEPRWNRAQEQFSAEPKIMEHWWRDRYIWEEQDGKRTSITAEELHGLTFDFRYWRGPESIDMHLILSGLRQSASATFRFGPQSRQQKQLAKTPHQEQQQEQNNMAEQPQQQLQQSQAAPPPQQQQLENGIVKGHPSGNNISIQWFLDKDGKGIQWGIMPQLWPKAKILRMESWGWEIQNPHVVMRSLDDDGNNNNTTLWRDYLGGLMCFQVRIGRWKGVLEAPRALGRWQHPTEFPGLFMRAKGQKRR